MHQYITFEVMQGAYDIACPDPDCDRQGVLTLPEMENIVGKETMDKHRAFRLNTGRECLSRLVRGLLKFVLSTDTFFKI